MENLGSFTDCRIAEMISKMMRDRFSREPPYLSVYGVKD